MKQRKYIFLLIIAILLFVQGCTNEQSENEVKEESEKLIVAVSIIPEETFVRAICGDKVHIITMIPPGMSPETYEPTPETMSFFQDADLYFAIGVPAEDANIISKIGEDTDLINLHELVAEVYEDRYFEAGGRDPHIWLSLNRAKVMVEIITEKISLLDEKNRTYYEENKDKYIEEIETKSMIISEMFENSNASSFITYHPSFGYFAEEYGLTMYSLEEEGKEATVTHLQEIIDIAKEKNIHTVFYQAEVDSKQSEAFAAEIDGNAVELAPLAADYLDNMEEMAKKIIEGMN